MPRYEVPGPDGQTYIVNGPRDATPQELQQYVNLELESRLAAQPKRQEQSTPPGRDYTLSENIFGGMKEGLLRDTAGAAGLGIAALLPENLETPVRDAIVDFQEGVTSDADPEAFSTNVGRVVGQLGGQIGAAGIATLLGGPGAGLATAAGTGSAIHAGEASERARAAGISPEERTASAIKGAGLGIAEAAPIAKFVRFLPKGAQAHIGTLSPKAQKELVQKAIKRANAKAGGEASAEAVDSAYGKVLRNRRIRDKAVDTLAVGGPFEAAQEVATSLGQDLIESGYNPAVDFGANATDEALFGYIGGAIANAILPGKTRTYGQQRDAIDSELKRRREPPKPEEGGIAALDTGPVPRETPPAAPPIPPRPMSLPEEQQANRDRLPPGMLQQNRKLIEPPKVRNKESAGITALLPAPSQTNRLEQLPSDEELIQRGIQEEMDEQTRQRRFLKDIEESMADIPSTERDRQRYKKKANEQAAQETPTNARQRMGQVIERQGRDVPPVEPEQDPVAPRPPLVEETQERNAAALPEQLLKDNKSRVDPAPVQSDFVGEQTQETPAPKITARLLEKLGIPAQRQDATGKTVKSTLHEALTKSDVAADKKGITVFKRAVEEQLTTPTDPIFQTLNDAEIETIKTNLPKFVRGLRAARNPRQKAPLQRKLGLRGGEANDSGTDTGGERTGAVDSGRVVAGENDADTGSRDVPDTAAADAGVLAGSDQSVDSADNTATVLDDPLKKKKELNAEPESEAAPEPTELNTPRDFFDAYPDDDAVKSYRDLAEDDSDTSFDTALNSIAYEANTTDRDAVSLEDSKRAAVVEDKIRKTASPVLLKQYEAAVNRTITDAKKVAEREGPVIQNSEGVPDVPKDKKNRFNADREKEYGNDLTDDQREKLTTLKQAVDASNDPKTRRLAQTRLGDFWRKVEKDQTSKKEVKPAYEDTIAKTADVSGAEIDFKESDVTGEELTPVTDEELASFDSSIDDSDAWTGEHDLEEQGSRSEYTKPLSGKTKKHVQGGDLTKALKNIATDKKAVQIAKVAEKLVSQLSNTKIVAKENLTRDGKRKRGYYDTKNDTIYVDSNIGMDTRTLLHEAAHAATVKVLANKSNPTTIQLKNLYNDLKPIIKGEPGSKNVEEFVAEALGNPAFRAKLDNTIMYGNPVKPQKMTALGRLGQILRKFIRTLFGGRTPSNRHDKVKQFDMLLDRVIFEEGYGDPALRAAYDLGAEVDIDDIHNAESKHSMEPVIALQKHLRELTPNKSTPQQLTQYLKDKWEQLGSKAKALSLYGLQSNMVASVAETVGVPQFRDVHKSLLDYENESHRGHAEVLATLGEINDLVAKDQRGTENYEKFGNIIHSSTLDEVNIFVKKRSDYSGDKQQIYDDLKKQLAELPTEYSQAGQKLFSAYKELVDDLRKVAKGQIDELTEVGEERNRAKRAIDELFDNTYIDPYFPLKREGRFGLRYYIKRKGQPEAVVVERFETPQEREAHEERLRYVSASPNNDVEIYWQDPNQAKPIHEGGERQQEAGEEVNRFVGELPNVMDHAPTANLIAKAIDAIRKGSDEAGVNQNSELVEQQLKNVVQTLLESTPQTSYMRALMRRENVLGFKNDPIGSAEKALYAMKDNINRLKWTAIMQKQLRDANNVIRNGPEDIRNSDLATQIKAHFEKRVSFALSPPQHLGARIARAANRANFLFTLGFNFSSPVVNAMHYVTAIRPYLTGRYERKSINEAMGMAYKLFMDSPTTRVDRVIGGDDYRTQKAYTKSYDHFYKMTRNGEFELRDDIDIDDTQPYWRGRTQRQFLEDIKPFISAMSSASHFHRSILQDQLDSDQFHNTRNQAQNWYEKVNMVGALPFHMSEQFVRQMTGLSVYLAELDAQNSADYVGNAGRNEAADTAAMETERLNGGSMLSTASNLAQHPASRTAMMFKSFGVAMYWHQGKMIYDYLNDQNLTPDQKRVLWKQFWGTQGMVTAVAGVQGLTAYGIIRMIYDMFQDDEDESFDSVVYRNLHDYARTGGTGIATSILFGNSGLSVSERIGMSDLIFSGSRYSYDRPIDASILSAMFGVSYSTFIDKPRRAISDFSEGRYWRAMEDASPAFLANILKGSRYMADGNRVLTRRHDVVTEDLTTRQVMAQMLGFAAEDARKDQLMANMTKTRSEAALQRRSKLLKRRNIAERIGDWRAVASIDKEINEDFNRRWPQIRISAATIRNSRNAFKRTSDSMYKGVAIDEKLFDYHTRMAFENGEMIWE